MRQAAMVFREVFMENLLRQMLQHPERSGGWESIPSLPFRGAELGRSYL
jgi:hypothetical protein